MDRACNRHGGEETKKKGFGVRILKKISHRKT
jgi:hypothetical protein